MRQAIIGAGGFVGRRVAARAAGQGLELVLNDLGPLPDIAGAAQVRARVCDGVDSVIHLAAILGGAAESDPALARRVNVDATLDLFDHLRAQNPGTRVVFASTIAVFGKPMPDPVTDATPTAPSMLYGAQKLMIEVALSHLARRGWLDGISLRPSGVMARDGADAGLKSAFLSRLFWCMARGEDITLPVAEDSRTWLTSVDSVAANFLHAATAPDLGPDRALTLPALSLTFGELVAALRRRFPASPSRITFAPDPATVALFGSYPRLETAGADALGWITFAPDPATVALFGSYPRLETAGADALGFHRDADADALVRASMV